MGLDWIAAVLTLVSTQLIAMKKWQGWVVKGCNCALWFYLMYHAGFMAFVLLEVVHLSQAVYGVYTWKLKGPR